MKKMTFLVPAYKGLHGLEKNKNFGRKVTDFVDVILVEDSNERQMERFCLENNITYYSKTNGNWGSVINFAVKNRIVKTEGVAIVDVDDTVKIDELVRLISSLENKYEVIFTKSNDIDYESGRKIATTKNRGVHSSGIKTELFNSISPLPEGCYYTDVFFMAFVNNAKKYKLELSLSPYNYYKNIPGQSVAHTKYESLAPKIASYKVLEDNFEKFLKENNLSISRKEINASSFIISRVIRDIYEKTTSKDELFKLRELYISNYSNKKIPVLEKLFGSYAYRFFTFKGLKTK